MNLRHTAFAAAFRAISLSGAHRWARRAGQGAGVILTLHHVRPWTPRGFAPNRLLEITPDFLDSTMELIRAEGFDLVSLDEMIARIREPMPGRFAVALTFDDGYRDNVEHARPILSRHGAPWTLYVAPGLADGEPHLWWLMLEAAIRASKKLTLTIAGRIHDHDLTDDRARQAAFDDVYWALRARPEAELRAHVERLAERAGIDGAALTRSLCLGWDDLRDLASDPAVTFGAHTLTHPRLASLPLQLAQPEMLESKYRLEVELGRDVRHFAYPVGDRGSAGPREFDLAKHCGFASAVTTRPGHVFAEHAAHLTALPRVSLNGFHQNAAALRALLSGLPFLALNRGRRLNVA